ncbi:Cysteinyl-tRNA synthetase [Candidatus Riesia pediculischaeffi PTSU]|uniref:Cysteine--tRNA ligase n=1 Tax=Candidatus Riesia pediculischaeffi PTSU TaxID=1401651 RepID=A0A0C1VJ00_9ENTR|nr:Cysteinyl-tRNA synthetase [Candidatus Riesia pediculischaeffi PTSU]
MIQKLYVTFFYLHITGSHLDYSSSKIDQSKRSLEKLYFSLIGTDPECQLCEKKDKFIENFRKEFIEAMNDDFNTPEAYSILFRISKKINLYKKIEIRVANKLARVLRELANSIGLLEQPIHQFFRMNRVPSKITTEMINSVVRTRERARKNKNWKEADRIRKNLQKIGVVLEDSSDRTNWRMK